MLLVIDLPDVFEAQINDELKTFRANNDLLVYYYGENEILTPLYAKNVIEVLSSITFKNNVVATQENYSVSVNAFAIQADFYEKMYVYEAWKDVHW